MKIAIYGDSFGTEEPIYQTYHKNLEKIGVSWVSLLKQHYDITNFCEAGSDHYFSFNNFLENYKLYDINIFIETSPYRLSTVYKNTYIHNHNIDSARAKLKNETNLDKTAIYQASIDYFLYLQHNTRDETISKLFREKISLLDPNCLIIESFGDNGLFNITLMENQVWNFSPTYTKNDQLLDLRYCHMTMENNQVFYSIIKDCIEEKTEFVFQRDKFIAPKKEDQEIYLVKK